MILEADTRAGRRFDLMPIGCIPGRVAVVVLDNMAGLHARFGGWPALLECGFTTASGIEYVAGLQCVRHAGRYARSVIGVIEL